MIALIQRCRSATVEIDNQGVAEIGAGLLALIGIEKGDTQSAADQLLQKLLAYRVFSDETGRMNLNLQQIRGGLLLVPNFTLAADTGRGLRPSFDQAEEPIRARALFERLVSIAQDSYPSVAAGVFGADMQVQLINDGPVTFWLQSGG